MSEVAEFVVSWMILVMGLSFILQPGQWLRLTREITEAPSRFLPFVFFILLLGLTVVGTHNIWQGGWPVVITVLGWIMALKGAVLLCAPGVAGIYKKWSDGTMSNMLRIAGVAYTVFGALLVFKLVLN